MNEVDKALAELRLWAEHLCASLDTYRPQILRALNPRSPLPDGFPSRAALADLVFDQIRKRIGDVQSAAKAVEDSFQNLM